MTNGNIHKMGNQNQQPVQPGQVQITQDDIVDFEVCCNDECDSETFYTAKRIGYVSKLHPGNTTGQKIRAVLDVLICTKCQTEQIIKEGEG